MAKKKNLNSSVLLKQYDKEFVPKKITVTIGDEEYQVLVDQKFKTSKLEELLLEGAKNFEQFKELPENVRIAYFTFLIIKYFTNIDVAKTEDFNEQIRVLNALLDLDILGQIMNAFPETELIKFNQYVRDFADKVAELAKNAPEGVIAENIFH